jgi:hypothetical protein
MMIETIAQRRPTIALSSITGSPVTLASVITGMPIDPNATGAVLASRTDAGSVERIEAEAGEHRARHRDRRTESRGALDERAEREGDEHRLQTPIVGQAADRVLDDLELAGVHRQSIEHDRGEHDPRDREETERGAVDRRDDRQLRRHPVDNQCDEQRRHECRDRGHPCRLPKHAEHEKQHDDRNRRDDGGQTETPRWVHSCAAT